MEKAVINHKITLYFLSETKQVDIEIMCFSIDIWDLTKNEGAENKW